MIGTLDHRAQTEALVIALADAKTLRVMLQRVLKSGLIDRKEFMWPVDQLLLQEAEALVAR